MKVLVFSKNNNFIENISGILREDNDMQYIVSLGYQHCIEEYAGLAKDDVLVVDLCYGGHIVMEELKFILSINSQATVLPIVSDECCLQLRSPLMIDISYAVKFCEMQQTLLPTIRFISIQHLILQCDSNKSNYKTTTIVPELIQQSDETKRLSRRQVQVMYSVLQGFSNEQIAAELNITIGTVKSHLNTIFRKLNIKSRSQIYSCLSASANQYNRAYIA